MVDVLRYSGYPQSETVQPEAALNRASLSKFIVEWTPDQLGIAFISAVGVLLLVASACFGYARFMLSPHACRLRQLRRNSLMALVGLASLMPGIVYGCLAYGNAIHHDRDPTRAGTPSRDGLAALGILFVVASLACFGLVDLRSLERWFEKVGRKRR